VARSAHLVRHSSPSCCSRRFEHCSTRSTNPVEVIGAALLAKAIGHRHRRIAAALGLPATTVRGWLRRFSRRAAELWALAAQLAHRYDFVLGPIAPQASSTADAVEALGVAARAVVLRFGLPRSTPWQG
jgi:hypothetical protein